MTQTNAPGDRNSDSPPPATTPLATAATPPPESGNHSFATGKQLTESFAREPTDVFADLPPEDAARLRIEQKKLMAPLLVEQPEVTWTRETRANPLSLAFLAYLWPLQKIAEEKDAHLDLDDIEPVIGRDLAEYNHTEFERCWAIEVAAAAERKAKGDAEAKPSLMKALVRLGAWELFCMSIYLLIELGFPFTTVILLKYINEFMLDPHAPQWHGGIFVVVIFFTQLIQSLGAGQVARFESHLGIRLEGGVRMAVAQRSIGLSGDGLKACGGAGALFQVFSGDLGRMGTMIPQIYHGGAMAVQAVAALAYLFGIITWPAVGALIIFCIVLPFNYKVSDKFIGYFILKMIAGDQRTKKIVEILNNIRTVKFYGWEKPFVALVAKLREPELVHTSTLMKLIAYVMCSFSVAAPLMQIAIYALMIADDAGQLTVVRFFQSMSLVNILAGALMRLPWTYSSYLQMVVSADRVVKVLTADHKDAHTRAEAPGAVTVKDGVFVWSIEEAAKMEEEKKQSLEQAANEPFADPQKPVAPAEQPTAAASKSAGARLKVPEFDVLPGELAIVVGKLGGGKSALMSCVLGEMMCMEGTCEIAGRVAYTPQTAWVINATIRNNIIMQNDFNLRRYEQVVHAVDLHIDFQALPNGDLTEIGEKGINLSGGQKQRVSLARALYTEADVYLFDDPLSALDAHVGRHVFDEGICGMLKGKTRILVTHAMSTLAAADKVYVADNMIVERVASVPSASALPPEPEPGVQEPAIIQLLRAWHGTKNASKDESASTTATAANSTEVAKPEQGKKESKKKEKLKTSGALTVQEERLSGQVTSDTLFTYLGSFGGVCFWFIIILLHCLSVGGVIFANLWLGLWSGGDLPASIQYKYKPEFYIGIYAAVVAGSGFVVLIRELIWREGAVNAPRVLYRRMSDAVFRTSMAFFDTTPIGRIINRFTKDAEQLDFQLPFATNSVFTIVFQQFGSLVSICVLMPWFSPVAAALIIILFIVQPTVATVVLRRLSSALVGPTVALYSESVHGAACIRAASLNGFFMKRFARTVNDAHSARLADMMLFQAVNVRIGVVMAAVAALVLLIMMLTKEQLSAARASFVVTQAMSLSLAIVFLMFQRGQFALSLNSIERLAEFAHLPPEAEGKEQPPDQWPDAGRIELHNVSAQYRPDKPLVLRDVNVEITPGEKIGVVGRTGSGKSSLLLTLFRLIPVVGESQIVVDGVDIATVPLDLLRSKLSAIPQEPVLFSGTVKENIDPFGVVPDEKLLLSLQRAHLEETLKAKAEAAKPPVASVLDLPMTDASLSNGEKQLLCLARALARDLRVLVLDEATSSVDPHTDRLIQQTIRTSFKSSTVITVAHRLNTVMDSDRVLVLDQGKVVEFDSPAALLQRPNGVFAGLVADAERDAD